jgi:hypothetical protein
MDIESLIQKLDNIYINNINIISKPTENITSKPTENITSKPTENITSKPTENITSKPTENITSKPTENITSNVTDSETVDLQYSEDEYLYKKPWTKLNNIHKIIKIKDYLRCLDLDKSVKKDLEKNLVDLIKKKILTKKEKVNYSQIDGHIINIPNLDISKGKYLN